ncbi:MAG: hypothetical protein ACT4OO_07390 [Nitrospiraceae bacterium]
MTTPRVLTHDEQKAAEAAFQRLPLNPTWTKTAQSVYHGLTVVLTARDEAQEYSETEPEYLRVLEAVGS